MLLIANIKIEIINNTLFTIIDDFNSYFLLVMK